MNDYEIHLSRTPVTVRVITGGALVLTACILTTIFFDRLVSAAPQLQTLLLVVLWIGLPLLWGIGTLLVYSKWPKTSYILTTNALQVRKKGWFSASSEQLYRYDNILAVESSNATFGDYGTITITLSQLDPVIIHAVIDPVKQARVIKDMIAKNQPKIQAIPQ